MHAGRLVIQIFQQVARAYFGPFTERPLDRGALRARRGSQAYFLQPQRRTAGSSSACDRPLLGNFVGNGQICATNPGAVAMADSI